MRTTEQQKEYMRKYYQDHKQKIKAYTQKYYWEHKQERKDANLWFYI